MNCRGADPFVFFDPKSEFYYVYATDDRKEAQGETFLIYRTRDMIRLEYVGYALDIEHNRWAKDWFWAPIVLFNPHNELYYLFYSARVKDELLDRYFHDPHYEEGCRIGVATSTSPEGPFRNISAEPLDYNPYDRTYLNVEDPKGEKKLPTMSFQEAFDKAKRGTYFPLIDIDIYFSHDRAYFYFSRCCYKDYVYDAELGKYIEESHIICAEFDSEFWYDKEGKKMPKLLPTYRLDKQDGYHELIAYWREPQAWENAHVNDYEKTNGLRKDRRWSEGSTIFKKNIEGEDIYFLTYSCNNYEDEFYGVGIAYGKTPCGPFRKYAGNPIIHAIPEQGVYSTGHGSYINVRGKDYYVFHMRDAKGADRCIAWCELLIKSVDDISISPIHKCEMANHYF